MVRPIPPLNPLRAFEVAARHLSFTRAADELSVTPSAVSHQVKTLEENLGVALFVREGKTLTLTAAGKAYLPGIQDAFRQVAFATVQLRQSLARPALKVNLPPTFASRWLIPRLHRFMAAHPDLDLKVSTVKDRVDFGRDDIDVAVFYGRGVHPGLFVERCLSVEMFPVCAPRLLGGEPPLERPSDLRHHVLLHDSSTYSDVSNPDWSVWLEAAGAADVPSYQGPSFWPSHLVIEAAIAGLGVALVKRDWVLADLAAGRLVRPFETRLQIAFGYDLVCPRERLDDPRIRAFIDWVRRERDEPEPAAPAGGAIA